MTDDDRMTDDELIKEFTCADKKIDKISIRVLWITWPHPHTPESRWHTVKNLPVDTNKETIQQEREKLLQNTKYFRVCKDCKERNPMGWMLWEEQVCHSCAEKNHEVIF